MAELADASDLGPEGLFFKGSSPFIRKSLGVRSLVVEHWAFNLAVVGSNPTALKFCGVK